MYNIREAARCCQKESEVKTNERKNDEVCIGEIPEGNGVPLCRECVWQGITVLAEQQGD